jgi:single-stranded DNA-binding protein
MDLNKVCLSGLAVSEPILTRPANKTMFAYFSLQVNEQYNDASGNQKIRANILRVEGFGKAADTIMNKVQSGLRYYIDGYIRHDIKDDQDDIKIRIFTLQKEDSGDGVVYMQGIKQALEILEKSRDMDSAKDKLRSLVAAR